MSSEFGYIPEAPEQSFGNNKGIFTPTDIYDLTRADKYTNYGQLELIETQTYSTSVANIDFTSIQESEYNVHLLVGNFSFGTSDLVGVRFYESGVKETASVYQVARQFNRGDGTDGEARSTGVADIFIGEGTTNQQNMYVYIYNAGDNTKYTFTTQQATIWQNSPARYFATFGSGVLPQTSTVDGINIFGRSSGNNFDDFDVSLYGIKEYS